MNYIERYFKRKEKALKKNQSQNNLGKSQYIQKVPKKDVNMNNSIEYNKESHYY